MSEDLGKTATKKVVGGAPKDLHAVTVTTCTLWCYREHKFKEGDPRRECHLDLKKLDLDICPNCIHFGEAPQVNKKLLTGAEALIIAGALRQMRQTHDPLNPKKKTPDLKLGSDQTPPEAPGGNE